MGGGPAARVAQNVPVCQPFLLPAVVGALTFFFFFFSFYSSSSPLVDHVPPVHQSGAGNGRLPASVGCASTGLCTMESMLDCAVAIGSGCLADERPPAARRRGRRVGPGSPPPLPIKPPPLPPSPPVADNGQPAEGGNGGGSHDSPPPTSPTLHRGVRVCSVGCAATAAETTTPPYQRGGQSKKPCRVRRRTVGGSSLLAAWRPSAGGGWRRGCPGRSPFRAGQARQRSPGGFHPGALLRGGGR